MTTTDAPSKFRYEGNGTTDTFAFTGRIFTAEDLVVEIILRSDDSLVDTLTLTTDYTVTINGANSATIEVTAPNIPSALQDIQIRRSLDKTQALVLPTGTVFPAKSVETALDKVTAIMQELQEELDRKVGVPVTDSSNAPDVIQLLEDATEAAETAATAAAASASTASTAATTATTQAGIATAAAAGVSLPSLGAANTVLQVNAGGSALEYEKIKALNIDVNSATSATITATDEILFGDVSDSNLVKKDTVQGVLKIIYPVGAYYFSDVSTSPETVLGFGTWAAIDGKMLIGANGTYTAGSSGGSATTTQTTDTMAAHSHTHTTFDNAGAGSRLSTASSGGSNTISSNSTGSGNAMNTISPYFACYIWRRTA